MRSDVTLSYKHKLSAAGNLLEIFILVYNLNAMLISRLITAIAANGGKVAIGRHVEERCWDSPKAKKYRMLRESKCGD
jgi:hypothetical protein